MMRVWMRRAMSFGQRSVRFDMHVKERKNVHPSIVDESSSALSSVVEEDRSEKDEEEKEDERAMAMAKELCCCCSCSSSSPRSL